MERGCEDWQAGLVAPAAWGICLLRNECLLAPEEDSPLVVHNEPRLSPSVALAQAGSDPCALVGAKGA